MSVALTLATLLAQMVGQTEVDFGHMGKLVVPAGCQHVAGHGTDSSVGHLECEAGRSRIQYDIGFASPGAKPEPRGWCTVVSESERQPIRVLEIPRGGGRSLYVCELPPYYQDPARLVAVPSPTVSFYTTVKSPSDATWLLSVALGFLPR